MMVLLISRDVDVLEIQDSSQITQITNNFAGFTDIHVVPKTIQEFTTMYETTKSPAIRTDATSYRKSKITNRKY